MTRSPWEYYAALLPTARARAAQAHRKRDREFLDVTEFADFFRRALEQRFEKAPPLRLIGGVFGKDRSPRYWRRLDITAERSAAERRSAACAIGHGERIIGLRGLGII